ncbi:pentapeptide repeat-containing protein [Streptomyces scabiei]|uniref:pentapeptide repeat-containing protein n=1 Tax=Streptomyces TaxID=1883 RepID=UPI0039F5ADDB
MSVKTRPDTLVGRLALAARPTRPWLRIRASNWWTRVLLAGGAQLTSLDSANFTDANLTAANLTSTNLTAANLTSVELADAELTDANLTRADLTGASLANAELADADLTDAELGALWSERTRWPQAFAALMRYRSEPIGGGRYRVQGSGKSGAELSVPPVPVP